ncbi:MAG: NIPSNAP family protein [Acidobacteriota bacterium]|nr:NIPSNAP family protein [Acidobacteriota bacterium]
MIRIRRLLPAASLLLLPAAYWSGMSHSAQAQPKTRVFELRTYTTNEGKLPDLEKRFRDHTMEIFTRHGMTNVAYFVPQDPPKSQNTLIYILAHESRDAAKKSWDDFRNDPEWKKVAAASEENGKIVTHVDSVFMDPADFSPMK